MKKTIIFLVALTLAAGSAFSQARQIEGPLTVAVGDTVTFSGNSFGFTWSFSPSASFQIVGHSNNESVVVRVVSMPRDGRATVRLSGASFHIDVVEAGTAIPPAALPAPAAAPPPAAPPAAPTLTEAEALAFARSISHDDHTQIMVFIEAEGRNNPSPVSTANATVLMDAMISVFGIATMLETVEHFENTPPFLRMILYVSNPPLRDRVNSLLNGY